MKEIFTISANSNAAKAKTDGQAIKGLEAGKQDEGAKDFFSVMFSQIKEAVNSKNKGSENLAENILKTSGDEQTKASSEKKSLGDHLLKDILEIVSILKNSSEKKPSFPNYSDKLDKLLNKQSVLNDFKEVKNISDLFKLSKKYDLGLENITAKKIDMQTLKNEFPKLDKSFFNLPEAKEAPKETAQNLTKNENKSEQNREALFRSIDKNEQKAQKEPTLFEKIMQPKKDETKAENILIKDNAKDAKTTLNTEGKKQVDTNLHVKENTEGKKQVDTNLHVKENTKAETPNMAEVSKKSVKETNEATQKITPIIDDKKNDKKASKDEKEKVILPKEGGLEERVLNEQNTRAQEARVQANSDKKGFVETILQGLKNQKSTQNQNIQTQNQELKAQESTLNKDSATEVKSEVKTDSTIRATDFKNPIRSENLQARQAPPTNQTLNSFANDLRERIENYKPPMMKVQMALNPKSLGEVDVTIINRGNNLQVNITSNTTTMALFTQNQAEFKNSLVNMGFTNLDMNFSDQKEQKNQGNRQAQHGANTNEELMEEELAEQMSESVEITLPQYI